MVTRYDEHRVRAASLRQRIARAVSETLKDASETRPAIARLMSTWLGEEVSKNMLDAYASEARDDHTIPYLRLLALVHATGDIRPLQIGAEQFGHAVIDGDYLGWAELGELYDAKEDMQKRIDTLRRTARRRA